MNDLTTKTVFFIAGMAAGVLISWKIAQKKYEAIAEEEIESVKETFAAKRESAKKVVEEQYDEPEDEDSEKPEDLTPAEKAKRLRNKRPLTDYTQFSNKTSKKEVLLDDDTPTEPAEEPESKPEVVSPDTFGENDDYETLSLLYFADDVITDENSKPLTEEDIAEMVGDDFEEHFGEFEEDSVYIQNDKLKCYYEILRDARSYYKDVIPTVSHRELRPDEIPEEDNE